MASTLLSLSKTSAEAAAQAARKALSEGGIVAFPTETVYGLAVRGDDLDAVNRLFALKGRDDHKRLAQYVSSLHQVEAAGYRVNHRSNKLIQAFWPGPLTLILEDENAETLGFRCSSHAVAARMSAEEKFPILATSANLSGSPPLTSGKEIAETFGDGITLAIEDTETFSGQASTVLRIPRNGGFDILREGEVASSIIEVELATQIAFVCTGNTCRSPLAEVMFRQMLSEWQENAQNKVNYEVISAGTSAIHGAPPSENSLRVAQDFGLDLSKHRSQPISESLMKDCDFIFTMTRSHRDLLTSVLGKWDNQIVPLAGETADIADPFGGSLKDYRACAEDIQRHLRAIMEVL